MHKKDPNRCVAWLRKELDFTQQQLATLIGSKQPTIQSIETGRLALSEHFAFTLERKTQISHRWLLENDPNVPAITPAGKPWSRDLVAKGDVTPANLVANGTLGDFNEMTHFFDRMQLMQTYVLFRGILEELGHKGAKATGFNTKLHKASLDLLTTITDKKVRERVYSEATKVKLSVGPEAKLQNEEKLRLVARDAKELLRISRAYVKDFDESVSMPGFDARFVRSHFEETGVFPPSSDKPSGRKAS